ncbi:MAG: DUF4199 domain-containing protein [Bacteroidota bacterium]
MKKITPLVKGLISGVLMVGISLLLNYTGRANSAKAQYLFYILYAGAITWTLLGYYRSENYHPSFGSIFGQGFRCFIIITLITVIFVAVYTSTHPEVQKEALELYEADLKKDGNRNEAEREKMIASAKKQFLTGQVSLATFGSLITGAVFTAAGAGLLLMRKK